MWCTEWQIVRHDSYHSTVACCCSCLLSVLLTFCQEVVLFSPTFLSHVLVQHLQTADEVARMRDFNNIRQVDNNVRAAFCIKAQHLIQFVYTQRRTVPTLANKSSSLPMKSLLHCTRCWKEWKFLQRNWRSTCMTIIIIIIIIYTLLWSHSHQEIVTSEALAALFLHRVCAVETSRFPVAHAYKRLAGTRAVVIWLISEAMDGANSAIGHVNRQAVSRRNWWRRSARSRPVITHSKRAALCRRFTARRQLVITQTSFIFRCRQSRPTITLLLLLPVSVCGLFSLSLRIRSGPSNVSLNSEHRWGGWNAILENGEYKTMMYLHIFNQTASMQLLWSHKFLG